MQRIDVLWRDIPSQVQIKRGRERGKYLLEHRFQAAIDRAAMRAGKGGSDAYLEEWRRITTSIESDLSPQELAEQIGRILEAEVTRRLRPWLQIKVSRTRINLHPTQ